MVTKNIPYKANTIPELFLKIINEPIIPPKQYDSNISEGVENIIYKATAKERFSRFQTIEEFIEAFNNKNIQNELSILGKYYFPQLLSFFTYLKRDTFALKQAYDYFGGCDCHWCYGKDAVEIGTGDKGIQLHCWQMMIKEVEHINSIETDKKVEYIKNRIVDSIKEFESLPKHIMSRVKSNDYYKLLKNILKVI